MSETNIVNGAISWLSGRPSSGLSGGHSHRKAKKESTLEKHVRKGAHHFGKGLQSELAQHPEEAIREFTEAAKHHKNAAKLHRKSRNHIAAGQHEEHAKAAKDNIDRLTPAGDLVTKQNQEAELEAARKGNRKRKEDRAHQKKLRNLTSTRAGRAKRALSRVASKVSKHVRVPGVVKSAARKAGDTVRLSTTSHTVTDDRRKAEKKRADAAEKREARLAAKLDALEKKHAGHHDSSMQLMF